MTHFLLKIGQKSLFSDRQWGIGVDVLNYDTFPSRRAPKQAKMILWKMNFRRQRILPQNAGSPAALTFYTTPQPQDKIHASRATDFSGPAKTLKDGNIKQIITYIQVTSLVQYDTEHSTLLKIRYRSTRSQKHRNQHS